MLIRCFPVPGIAATIIMLLLNCFMGCASKMRSKEDKDPGPAPAYCLSVVHWIFGLALIISFSVNCRDKITDKVQAQYSSLATLSASSNAATLSAMASLGVTAPPTPAAPSYKTEENGAGTVGVLLVSLGDFRLIKNRIADENLGQAISLEQLSYPYWPRLQHYRCFIIFVG